MVTKCANPACTKPFLYLREGKVLRVSSPSAAGPFRHPVEHFWLCGACSKEYDVVREGGTVSVVRRRRDRMPNEHVLAFLSNGRGSSKNLGTIEGR
jgi:hypothetical protein